MQQKSFQERAAVDGLFDESTQKWAGRDRVFDSIGVARIIPEKYFVNDFFSEGKCSSYATALD